MLTDTRNAQYSKVVPLKQGAVKWTDGLWADSYKVCATETVMHLKAMFDDKDVSHVIENFKICAGEAQGQHDGTVFGDGDFYKWMEAALYTAYDMDNEALKEEIRRYVDLIGRAQQPDGYLSTKQIIGEMQQNGIGRMGDINDFEVYNFGHLFTTACLHKRITGEDSFLNIAVKVAAYLDHLYQTAKETGEVQTAVCPSHYMGLVELYRTTGDEKYKVLAETAISMRDSVSNGTDDNQDRIPLKSHTKILGHAVRANYLYAGVADLCAEIGDEEYSDMLDLMWEDLIKHKLYIIGGCGALYNGVSPYGNFFVDQKTHQAYGYEYQLPNITAYNETCASIGLVMWAYRMFNIKPNAVYYDVLEKTMLNINLAAISLDGRKFFYENMLRRAKELKYELVWPLTRTEYITSYCCPPNLARAIAQSPEYVYSMAQNDIYTIMYGSSRAHIQLEDGTDFMLEQITEYPYDGKITFRIEEVAKNGVCNLQIRIPGWVESGSILYNGIYFDITQKEANSFVSVNIDTNVLNEIQVIFEMPVRMTTSHTMVEENTNQVAIEKGPLVYCVESVDVQTESIDDIYIPSDVEFEIDEAVIMNRKIQVLKADVLAIDRSDYDRERLYQPMKFNGFVNTKIQLIPYFAWDNREFGEMKVWLPIVLKSH